MQDEWPSLGHRKERGLVRDKADAGPEPRTVMSVKMPLDKVGAGSQILGLSEIL